MATLASRRSYADSMMSNSQQMNDIHSPGVTASSSGDTINSTIDTLPRTPQALRGRKTAATIRQELGLPRRQLDWLPPLSRNYETANGDKASASRPMLPPMLPSTSIASPQVSTSSFYTHSSNSAEDVARSPSLVAGHARTAVGALLANSQHSFHGTESSILSSTSALQSRNWAENQSSGMSKGMNDINSEYESMASQGILPTRHRSDEESFSHASPSSDYHRNAAANRLVASNLETSFSRSFAVDHFEHHVPRSMNTMEGNDFFVHRNQTSTQDLNVSGMSQSTKDIESLVGYGLDEEILSHCEDMIGSDRQDFNSLGFSKAQGQRYDRDDLLFSTIERLQDEALLVKEIMEASSQGGGNTLLSNSMSRAESFFAGFAKSNRDAICSIIEGIIRDRPSTFQRISQQRDDFEQALRFIIALVRISVPASEKSVQSSSSGLRQEGQWRCVAGFRASIGLVEEPKSPDTIRGGDTSLFSLPSESATAKTPHTSNVSVTTTITSAFSPDKPEGIQKKLLRQTLETVVTLFDRLGKCCTKLMGETFASSNIAVMAAEEVTRIYLQVHTISINNLEALVDSFELDILSQLQIQRPRTQKMELSLKLPSTTSDQVMSALDRAPAMAAPQTLTLATKAKSIESRDDQGPREQALPQTQNIRNVDTATRESEATPDRLDEKRDAPPASLAAAPSSRNVDRKKVRRTRLWRRRLVPKRRTAE